MKHSIQLVILLSAVFMLFSSCNQANEKGENLVKSPELNNWQQLNGNARYTYENGMIVGETVLNTPNSFLCTKESYNDFILTLEFKVDPKLNSGVQIRSNSIPEYRNNRVHGYQVEIDPSDRAWSGGIYDEARRGWLYNLENNEAASKAFKNGEWNSYRIEALGDTIQTWVNGVPAANLVDNMTSEGFIGLQVHGIGGDKEKEGIQVKWRNIRILTGQEALADNKAMDIPQKTNLYNSLTQEEKEQGWELLFDGKSHDKWRGAHKDKFPEKGWIVHNASLTVVESGGGEAAYGGDIVTKKEYSDFELQLDFRLTEGANSGIKYYVTENEEGHEGSALGLEYQILDDKRHPDAKRGRNGNRTLASLYDLMPAAKDKDPNPVGEWNHARIVAKDNHIEHWLNGDKVLEYERGSKEFRKFIEMSKYSDPAFSGYGGRFGEAEKGHILLQDHGNRVSFRNIKIREL